MAVGYANAATLAYANWTGLATVGAAAGLVQSVTSPGWTRAVADVTAIDQADGALGTLRKKLASFRLEHNGVTVAFFYDPDSTGLDSPPLDFNTLTMTYPSPMAPTSVYAQSMFVTAFSIGNMVDDEISVCECEFMPAGDEAFDDPTAA